MSEHLAWAGRVFKFAEAQTHDLDGLTFRLKRPSAAVREKEDVWRLYLAWAVFGRQVAVSINSAGKVAGCPPEFMAWWDALDSDAHRFFWAERNAALKDGIGAILGRDLSMDDDTTTVTFWAFPHGPYQGQPLVPQCLKYNDWMYHQMLAPARELLFPWMQS